MIMRMACSLLLVLIVLPTIAVHSEQGHAMLWYGKGEQLATVSGSGSWAGRTPLEGVCMGLFRGFSLKVARSAKDTA